MKKPSRLPVAAPRAARTASVATITLQAIAAQGRAHALACTLSAFLAGRTEHERADVLTAIRDHALYSGPQIIRELRKHGYTCGDQVIQRHRREGCKACGIEPPG